MKAYKGTNKDMQCQGFQFEIGIKYSIPENVKLKLCHTGFHSCNDLKDVHEFYIFQNSRLWEVEIDGETIQDLNKQCSRHITFIKELSFYEVMKLSNKCEGENLNLGFFNIGNYNVGNFNKGNYNIGNYNIGNDNKGNNSTVLRKKF